MPISENHHRLTNSSTLSDEAMKPISYFDGITFAMFGLNRTSTMQAHNYPKYYGLQYIHAGHVNLTIDHGTCHQLHGPVAFITVPQYFYDYYSPEGTERQHYFVCFSGERVGRYRQGGLLQFDLNHPYFPIQDQKSFLQGMLNLILSIQNEENHGLSVAYLEQMLYSAHLQQAVDAPTGFYLAALENLAQKIMLNPERAWDFRKEATNLNISEKHFQLLFRKTHGLPPHHFVLRQRLFRAMELLTQKQTSIKSVALACGFNNELYFSRLFKKYFNQSPTDYRKTL